MINNNLDKKMGGGRIEYQNIRISDEKGKK